MNATKEKIINKISESTGFSKNTVSAVISSMFEEVINEVSIGNRVIFSGFGVFETKLRASRMGRNPVENKPIIIPSRIVPVFKPGKVFKDKINEVKK